MLFRRAFPDFDIRGLYAVFCWAMCRILCGIWCEMTCCLYFPDVDSWNEEDGLCPLHGRLCCQPGGIWCLLDFFGPPCLIDHFQACQMKRRGEGDGKVLRKAGAEGSAFAKMGTTRNQIELPVKEWLACFRETRTQTMSSRAFGDGALAREEAALRKFLLSEGAGAGAGEEKGQDSTAGENGEKPRMSAAEEEDRKVALRMSQLKANTADPKATSRMWARAREVSRQKKST